VRLKQRPKTAADKATSPEPASNAQQTTSAA
jgi:hypothetical protein